MKILLSILLSLLLGLTVRPPKSLAEPNAIVTLQSRLDSLVTVSGRTYALNDPSDGTQVAVNPSGQIVTFSTRRLQFNEKSGAGVIISPDGHIVTNTHVVFGSQSITVTFKDGTEKAARVLYVSRTDDFSILKIDSDQPLTAVEFAEEGTLKLGDEVTTIGHSDLLRGTFSGGRISGIGTRRTDQGDEIEIFRLNINHYSGDSGGPVFDRSGRLLGLICAKRLSADRELFAIPASKIHFADINLADPYKSQ